MPIVFVHGVNNRDGKAYKENESSRNGFLREIIGPALGLSPDKLKLFSPYWGSEGAMFAWNMKVLPDPDAKFETFGAGSTDEAFGRVVTVVSESNLDGSISLVENARKDFVGVVDALYAAAMAGAPSDELARDLARSYLLASEYAAKNPSPAWLGEAKDSNFVDHSNMKPRCLLKNLSGLVMFSIRSRRVFRGYSMRYLTLVVPSPNVWRENNSMQP